MIDDNQRAILQELMNIGFGKAVADLSKIIGRPIGLSIPKVHVISKGPTDLSTLKLLKNSKSVFVASQSFISEIAGTGFFIVNQESLGFFVQELKDEEDEEDEEVHLEVVKGLYLELTGLVVAACIKKLCELLNVQPKYSTPGINAWQSERQITVNEDGEQFCVALEAVFSLGEEDHEGYLYLLFNQSSIEPLKTSLVKFLENYT